MEKSEVKLPKRRKASNSSQKSEKSDHGETVSVRQKEYKNLLRLESLNPSVQGSISPINQIVNFQDSELKEITAFIDEYLRSLLNHIETKDSIIGVKSSSKNSETTSKTDRLIQVENLIPIDLLRNGLQSSVAIQCQIKSFAQGGNKTQSSLPKIGLTFENGSSPDSAKNEKNNYGQNANMAPSTPSVLFFNYELVLALNDDYFKLEQPSSSTIGLFKIQVVRRPSNWSQSDMAKLTLEFHKSSGNIKRNISAFNSRNMPIYLNSKAMIDHLYTHFTTTLKHNWPKKQAQVVNPLIHKIHIVGEDPELDLNELSTNSIYRAFSSTSRSSIASSYRAMESGRVSNGNNTARNTGSKANKSETKKNADKEEHMKRKCELETNRVRIEFKWKGNKPHFRNLRVIVVINIVVNIKNNYDMDSVTDNILKSFKIEPNDWKEFCTWFTPRLSLPLNKIFLSPASFVHLWTLDTRLAKLNMLKLLLAYDILKKATKSTNIKDFITLASNSNILNSSYSLQASLEEVSRSCSSSNNMLVFFRLIQIHFSQFLERWAPPKKQSIQDMDNEELLINLVLTEAKSNQKWSNECLFERLWSSLTKLRGQLGVDKDVSDVFGLVRNQVPPYILSLSNSAQFISSFEMMLRRLLKNVVVDETRIEPLEWRQSKLTTQLPIVVIKLNGELLNDNIQSSRAVHFDADTRLTITTNESTKEIKNEN